jgi:hypothetical protein
LFSFSSENNHRPPRPQAEIAIQEPPQNLQKPQNWLQLLATFVVAATERN